MTETVEQTAERIAERGRDALLARLRPPFEQAATANAAVVEIGAEHLEQLIQRAADHANGLQWRRALAAVAGEELGIGLSEALIHPAVARAQAIVGAQSYEDGLAELVSGRARPAPAIEIAPTHDAPTGVEPPGAATDGAATESDEPPSGPPLAAVRLAVVHVAGVATLKRGEKNLELRFSDAGLDIIRTPEGNVVGRLPWNEIEALEMPTTPPPKRRAFRRRPLHVQLLVRTAGGKASFETPGVTSDELREHLAPVQSGTRGAQRSE